MKTTKNRMIIIVFFIFTAAVHAQQASLVQPYASEAGKAERYIKSWTEGSEVKNFLQTPSLLGTLIVERNLSDFEEVPGWIRENLITDDQKLQKLANRMAVIYEQIPDARRIKVIYFNNPQPFFALGNRSLLFISSTSMEKFSANEFVAGGFHEIAHLVFADYYWDLRRAGNAAAVKQIELNCDYFSFLMLKKSHLPVKSLEQLLRKVDQMESRGVRDETEAQFYPSMDERLAALKAFEAEGRDRYVEARLRTVR